MKAVIGGKRYATETATEIASDCYWDGHNWERRGHNTRLYKTKNGSYFAVYLTQWQGERDRLEPMSEDQAIGLYEALPEKEIEFEQAFPNREVKDA